jgi:molybdopterin converting factor small subunit
MKVLVGLYATLQKFLPQNSTGRRCELELKEGATVGDVIELLNIPPKFAALRLVNGVQSKLDKRLSDGDRISIFPQIAGG